MAQYYFNLPPITQLTIQQQAALHETGPIALAGGPGTGKSVVSLWRHISNHKRNKDSLLLTYTTTLTKYLEMCCKNEVNEASAHVNSSLRWMQSPAYYDEIVVDEAQDLPITYYKKLKDYSNNISFGADNAQILYPDKSTSKEELQDFFNNKSFLLTKNFRSTQRIMQFAKMAFPEAYVPQSVISNLEKNKGEWPVLLIAEGSKYETSNSEQDNAILNIISSFHADSHNIAILVPWKKHVEYFYELIRQKFNCTKYHVDMNGCREIGNIHITTFKSAKGLEFDTVIIPNFDKMEDNLPALFHIEWQDFYVAVTRARINLYLISNHDLPSLESVTDKEYL